MLTIDETGMPKPPSLRQIMDKMLLFFGRDTTSDKRMYVAEVGVIYYLEIQKVLL